METLQQAWPHTYNRVVDMPGTAETTDRVSTMVVDSRNINTPVAAHDSIVGPPIDENVKLVKSIHERGPANEVLYESSVIETRLQNVYSNVGPDGKQSI